MKLIITSPEELQKIVDESVQRAFNNLPQAEPKKEITYIPRIETAKKLHISLVSLWKLTKEGKLNSYKIGSKVLYKVHEVENVARKMNFKPSNLY